MPSLNLSGPQQKALEEALSDAFPGLPAQERLVSRVDRTLSTEVGDKLSGRDRVFKLVEAAEAGGWTSQLLAAALDEQPDNPLLKAVAAQLASGLQPPPGSPLDIAEPSHFDLTELEQTFWETLQPAPKAGRRLVGFGIAYSDNKFVGLLRKRIARAVGANLDDWDPYAIDNRHNTVPYVVGQIADVRDNLRSKHSLFIVQAATAPEVVELWQGVSQAYPGSLDNFLVVVILQPDAVEFPASVVKLPPPSFRFSHLAAWTTQLLTSLEANDKGWTPAAEWAQHWSQHLYDRCNDAGSLVIRRVYDALEKDLKALRSNAAAFRQSLRKN